MLKIIIGILSMVFFLNRYIRTRYLRYLWAVTVWLFLIGLNVHHTFFMPADIFYSRLGWFSDPFLIAMVLSGLSLFWVCFAPIKQQTELKKARRWRSSIR